MKTVLRLLSLTLFLFLMATIFPASAQVSTSNGHGAQSFKNTFGKGFGFHDKSGFGERAFGERGRFGDRRGFGGEDKGGPDDKNGDDGGANAPLNDWLSLLLAAGLGLGLKKTMDRNKALRLKSIDIPD